MRRSAMCFFALMLAGCQRGSGGFSARNGVKSAHEFTASMSISPATLDPGLSQDVPTNDLMAMVFEGLVGWGEDNRIEPRLATSWDVSQDGRTYTFHLRDATFHNGMPVRAQDFKWTWERNGAPALQSPTPDGYLGDIKGVAEVIAGQSKTISGVQAVDERTLKVTLLAPRAYFLGKLTYPVASVMPSGILQPGKAVSGPSDMIGAGPFRITGYTPEAQVELAPFKNHMSPPSVKKLTLLIVKDASTRLNMLRNDKLDWAGLPQADVPAFRGDPKYTIIEADRPATFYLGMNGKVYPPFADCRVRQAFNHAIDKHRIVKDVLNGLGTPARGYLPPSVPQAQGSIPGLDFDVPRAKRLLKGSGWDGKLPPLELWVSDSNGDRKRVAELAISMLRENLGVDVNLRLVESSVLIQRATRKELGFFMGSWYMDYLDPENLLSVLLSSYGQNRTAYDNPRFSELCMKADAMPDGEKRLEVYQEAEAMVIQDAPWIPLYHPREAIAVHNDVQGLRSNAFGLLPPTQVNRPKQE